MTYVSQVLADGAVGFWKLGEPSGATATDAAGNSNGTYAGSITYGQTGIPGGGATAVQNTTSNSGNKVTIPSVAANQVTDTFTLEIWVKRTATQGATQRIMGGSGASGNPQFGFNSSNQLQVGKIAVSNIVASTSAITDTASFHHLVWTKSGATNKLYIDGTDVTGTPSNLTFTQNTSGWILMEDGSNNNAAPAGVTFAMAAIYPTALSAGTVATHFTLGSETAPVNTVAPAVTGTAQVGSVLTTTNGTWTDSGSPTFTYQWQRDVAGNGVYSNIGAATSSTYTLVSADDTCHVRCVVKDTDTVSNTSANSNATAVVTFPTPTNSVAPAVTGTVTVGSVLTTSNGTWTSSPTSFGYQWQDSANGSTGWANISAQTASTYTIASAEDTKFIRCQVTATNDGGTAAAVNSNVVGAVTFAVPTNSVAPAVTGTVHVGSVLTTTNGTWANTPTSYAYQWQDSADGATGWANISAQTASTYTIASAEDTKYIRCNVAATNDGGTATAVSSNVVGPVVFGVPVNSVAPAVTGSTPVGSVLTTDNGTWSNSPTSYSYQWTRDGSNIGSATSSTYTTVTLDLAHAVACKVTATNDGGNSTAVASNAITVTGSSLSTVVGKTGTSGTAVMQKTGTGYTSVTGKTGTSATAVDQKGAGTFTKITGH